MIGESNKKLKNAEGEAQVYGLPQIMLVLTGICGFLGTEVFKLLGIFRHFNHACG